MIVYVLLILLAVALIAAAVFWWAMGQPFYQPGALRVQRELTAPLQSPPVAASAKPGFWEVEPGIRLHYFSHGTGQPVLVLHGGPGFPFVKPLAALEPLTNRFQFFYYDQRGCGDSSRPFDRFASQNYFANARALEGTLGIGAQVADIERIRRILGQEKLILVGHSFGGFLATMYAVEFPDRVQALVLVAPANVLVFPQKNGFFEQIRQRLPAARQPEFDAFLGQHLNFRKLFTKSEAEWAALNRQLGLYFLDASGTASDPAYKNGPPNGGWMVQALYLSMGQRHDYRAALRRVTAPTLVLHGADDFLPDCGQYAEGMPNARAQVIAAPAGGKAGHFLFNDQPELFGQAVQSFLAVNPAPSRNRHGAE